MSCCLNNTVPQFNRCVEVQQVYLLPLPQPSFWNIFSVTNMSFLEVNMHFSKALNTWFLNRINLLLQIFLFLLKPRN